MSNAPAFQFYAAEFLADENVMLMDDAQVGVYIKLICICWREGSIPNDVEALKRLATKRPDQFENDWKWIAPCFRPAENDLSRLVHPRLEKEREKQKKFSKQQSKKAKKGWQSKLQRNAPGMPEKCQNDALQSSIFNLQNNPPTPQGGMAGFDEFWNAYPKKTTKKETQEFWAKNKLYSKLPLILNGLGVWKITDQWAKDGGKYIPDPIRFLRKERWADDVTGGIGNPVQQKIVNPAHVPFKPEARPNA